MFYSSFATDLAVYQHLMLLVGLSSGSAGQKEIL